MQRLSVASARVHGRAVLQVRHSQAVRRLVTGSTPSPTSHAVASSSTIKKRSRRVLRRILLYSTAVTLGVYGAGTLVALRNEGFHDFFIEFVPYGERIMEYAGQHGWEGHTVEPQIVIDAGRAAVQKLERAANQSVSATQKWLDKTKERAGDPPQNIKDGTQKIKARSDILKTRIQQGAEKAQSVTADAVSDIREQSLLFPEDVVGVVRKAEEALREDGLLFPGREPSSDTFVTLDKPTYTNELPIGFEAPPGFVLPATRKPSSNASDHTPVEEPAAPSPLPLVAPAVSEFSVSEPVLAQLATTIDDLASFFKDNPSVTHHSNARDVLNVAQIDLVRLGERLRQVKDEERMKLEDKLDEQAREYTVKLLQLEMDAQDKLDHQGEDWQKFFDHERQLVIQSYRAKLEAELQAQSEIINERLKEEVIAQGIELQRRWIREIKIRVEEERGGRLAKLDELAADLKRLSRVTFDNSAYLDENLRLHAMWSSIRALNAAVQSTPVRKPFREELRVLYHVAIAGGAREDPVIAVALDTLGGSEIPDVGVEPFADLASWFTTSVSPRVKTVALVPDQNAGLLSHLASSLLSSFRFQRRGLVKGDDVLSVLARAEYHLNEKDLDSATRELNQLKGPAKLLLSDWLDAARKRLEVIQAIEVVQSQATLASLLLSDIS